MKKISVLLCCFLLISLSGCSNTLHKYSSTATDIGFDTVVSFIAYTENEATYNKYNEILQKEFKRYDHLFDKYNNYKGLNNIKSINDAAGIHSVKVDKEIIALLKESQTYAIISNHHFDITMGSVLNIWHDYREASLIQEANHKATSIPSLAQLQQAKQHSGWNHLQIDEKKQTVYIDDAQVSLDVGGNAKGYAVEQIAKLLEKKGLQHAIINAGGNIRLIGNKPDKEAWRVGIQIPNLQQQSSDSLLSLKISDTMSIVTSGDYQRYYTYEGKTMHHIIDPTTLFPSRHCRSVSVITQDSTVADTLSTTLYTLSHADGVKLLDTLKKEKGIDVNAIWVYDKTQPREDNHKFITRGNYEIITTKGIEKAIIK